MADGIRDGKGNILKNTDPLFTELSENYPPNNYASFCNEFGVKYAQSQQLKIENLGCLQKALKQVLNKWLENGKEVTREKLELALENAQTGGLIHIVKEHFTKSAERDVPGEEDSEKKKTLSGATSIHNTVYLTNNITGQAAGSERRVDEPDGHSVNRTKTNVNLPRKMSIPMTDSHRKIIQKSTPGLLKDLDADDVTPQLLALGIITSQNKDKINSKDTRKRKVEELLEILQRRGDHAYSVFLDILEEAANHLYNVVKSFEQQDSSETQPTNQAAGPAGSLNTVDQPSRTGNTFSQTINASGDSSVIGTNMIGQINNYTN